MLLQRLLDYSSRLDLPPPNYILQPIPWLVELDCVGNLGGILSTSSGDKKDRKSLRPILVPYVKRTVSIRAKLLADNGEYVFGVAAADGDREKVAQRHAAFIDAVRRCAEATASPDVRAVLTFLENLDPQVLDLPENFDPRDEITFRVEGRLPVDDEEVRSYWAATFEDPDAKRMQCIVCGKERRAEERLQQSIKRIPGGQTSGNALISANAAAFESYGLRASLIAPTCRSCAERFSHALNALLAGEDTHINIGPVAYVFWTKEDVGFSPARMFSNPDPVQVKALVAAAFKGSAYTVDEDLTPFYACSFTASGSRVAVHDWIDTTVGAVRRALARYFRLQAIADWDGSEGPPLKLYSLAGATVRDLKDLPARVPKAVIKLALTGGPLPDDLLFQAVKRCRAEQGANRPRAALIKLCLLSTKAFSLKEEDMLQLDHQNTTPAYVCGRLLAVLENVQRAALGGVGATIVDRYFGTASSAPATVFGTLMRGAQAHLSKLRKQKPGLFVILEKEIEEVASKLSHFPPRLDLKEQGLFSLGYYHQRAYRKPKAENSDAAARAE